MLQLQGINGLVQAFVAAMLRGVQQQLSNELDGIARDVMQAAMELEILEVVRPKRSAGTR
jgi:hypothetical protein